MTEQEYKVELEAARLMIAEMRKNTWLSNTEIEELYMRVKAKALNRTVLTEKEKEDIRDMIQELTTITGHNYKALQFCDEPIRHTRLYHGYDNSYDAITEWKFKNQLKEDTIYTLEELGVVQGEYE